MLVKPEWMIVLALILAVGVLCIGMVGMWLWINWNHIRYQYSTAKYRRQRAREIKKWMKP